MILVDTSVWADHLRAGVPALAEALESSAVIIHPFVVGELACGNLKNRREVLKLLKDLPQAPIASDHEVLEFIETRRLMGLGLGYIDMHLLASARLAVDARLWTRDKRFASVAARLRLGFSE